MKILFSLFPYSYFDFFLPLEILFNFFFFFLWIYDYFNIKIFRLSTKAAIAACTSSASSINNNNNNYQLSQFAALCSAQLQQQKQQNFETFDIKQTPFFLNNSTIPTTRTTKLLTTSDDNNNKHLISVETQTEIELTTNVSSAIINPMNITNNKDNGIRLSACIGTNYSSVGMNKCGCRIIKVCCCGEETCLRNARNGGASSV